MLQKFFFCVVSVFTLAGNSKEYWLALYYKHLPTCICRSKFQVGRSRTCYSVLS